MKPSIIFMVFLILITISSCNDETILPKPKAMLRLEYERPSAQSIETDYFRFDSNKEAVVNQKSSRSIILEYPEMKATIFMSYRKVDDDIKNLISDAQKLSYEHAAKADGIRPRAYEDDLSKVYGAFFEVRGDAASQAQFYVTDSLNHFVTGSLYFKTRPNYDSIYPAAVYLQQDMGRIMESLRWK
ncbi:gliding motility lipoprotein GldD [Maribacter sp. 2308TA10-17]|uniref:gliding motility lipoprotein GldD n=1 Tax=Maribacter sp. 2308TA10-17 TaxID=3386276 RepID=UPI0039BCEC13